MQACVIAKDGRVQPHKDFEGARRRKGCEFCFVKCLGLIMLSDYELPPESVYKIL